MIIMKRKKILIIIIVLVVIVFGGFLLYKCLNSKADKVRFVCSYSEENEYVNISREYTLDYVEDKLKNYSVVLKTSYDSKDSDSEVVLKYKDNNIDDAISMAKNVDGIDISYSDDDNTIINKYVYNLEVLDLEENVAYKDIYPLYKLDDFSSLAVEQLKSWGYSCKKSNVK